MPKRAVRCLLGVVAVSAACRTRLCQPVLSAGLPRAGPCARSGSTSRAVGGTEPWRCERSVRACACCTTDCRSGPARSTVGGQPPEHADAGAPGPRRRAAAGRSAGDLSWRRVCAQRPDRRRRQVCRAARFRQPRCRRPVGRPGGWRRCRWAGTMPAGCGTPSSSPPLASSPIRRASTTTDGCGRPRTGPQMMTPHAKLEAIRERPERYLCRSPASATPAS